MCDEFFRIENMTMATPQINSKDNYERYKADPPEAYMASQEKTDEYYIKSTEEL